MMHPSNTAQRITVRIIVYVHLVFVKGSRELLHISATTNTDLVLLPGCPLFKFHKSMLNVVVSVSSCSSLGEHSYELGFPRLETIASNNFAQFSRNFALFSTTDIIKTFTVILQCQCKTFSNTKLGRIYKATSYLETKFPKM